MMMASGDFRLRAACSGPWSQYWALEYILVNKTDCRLIVSSFQAGTGYEPYQEQYIYIKGRSV